MCLAQGAQRSDASEARTRGPWFSSKALYHWVTALPQCYLGCSWLVYKCSCLQWSSCADPEGNRGRTPPGKSQVIWVSMGNKHLLPPPPPPPPPWKKVGHPWKMLNPSESLESIVFSEINRWNPSVNCKIKWTKKTLSMLFSGRRAWTPPPPPIKNSWICAWSCMVIII